MKLGHFRLNPLEVNCYILSKGKGAVIIDPGAFRPAETDALCLYLAREGLTPEAVLLTHTHYDHVAGVPALLEKWPGLPVYLAAEDRPLLEGTGNLFTMLWHGHFEPFPTLDLHDGDALDIAGIHFEVIATPGHTPGCVCYHVPEEKLVFTGDTLFAGTIGRTDLEGGDYDSLIRSIMEKLIWLDPDTVIYPGHGRPSDIGSERRENPMLEPFNEREELDL